MAVYIVTGNLGSGKSLVMMGLMRDYIRAGRRVATNVNVLLENLNDSQREAQVVRTPDHPSASFLWDQLGLGSSERKENTFGMLCIDEVGTWLNSREWKGGDRQKVIEWFIHSRKRRWDVFLIVQSLNMIDKQVRESIAEHVVICRRLDRLPIPLVGWIIQYIGLKLRMPQIHIAAIRYTGGGSLAASAPVGSWTYRGRDLWGSYDTSQRFSAANDGPATMLCPRVYTWLQKPQGALFNLLRRCEQNAWDTLHRFLSLFHSVTAQEQNYRFNQLLNDNADVILSQPMMSFAEWEAAQQSLPLKAGFDGIVANPPC